MDQRGITLEALHDLVPAAEEIDLADEVDAERSRARFERWFADELVRMGLTVRRADEPGAAEEHAGEPGPEAPTDLQALGLLEHELGAEVIEPE